MTVFDLDELALKNRRLAALSSLRYRKSDRIQWPLRFLQDETFVELPAESSLSVAVKRTRGSGSYLALATSPAKTGTGSSAIYTFDLNLNTEQVAYELSDKDSVECVLEVEIVTPNQRLTSQSVALTVERDIIANNAPAPVALPDLKATQQEAEAGADNSKWMTPLRTAQALAALAAARFATAAQGAKADTAVQPQDMEELSVNHALNAGSAAYALEAGHAISATSAANADNLGGMPPSAFAAKSGGDDIEVTDPSKGVVLRSPDGSRWRLTIGNDGTLQRAALAVLAFFALGTANAQIVKDLTTTNGTLQGTNLRINAATGFDFGGVGGVLEVEALDNHAVAAKASDITDGAAFYGWSESGAPAAKLVQSGHFNSPALTVWRTSGGDDALSPAVLISGSPASDTNKAFAVRNGTGQDVFWVKYDGTTSITNTGGGTVATNVAWAQGLTNNTEKLIFNGDGTGFGRLVFYASQTSDPVMAIKSAAGSMMFGLRSTNGFLQAHGNIRIEKQGGVLTGLQVANIVTSAGQTNSLPSVNATLVPWMGSASADPSSPVEGAIYFNTANSSVRIYAGGAWRPLN